MSNFKMDDYVPVNERIDAFYKAWPNGTLQSEIVELTADRVTVKAYAYREPDDARPGIGHSSLEIPGSTSFTRGSEIENAETSAWGRAIAALGFEVKRGVSSREEVRNKQPERGTRGESARPAPVQRTAEEQALLDEILAIPGMTHARMRLMADAIGVLKGERATADQLRAMLALNEPPDAGQGTPASGEGGGAGSSDLPAAADAPSPEALMDSILAVTNGALVPPKPGSPEYKALPSGTERSQAKAYWDREKQGEPEPESLAEQLRVETPA